MACNMIFRKPSGKVITVYTHWFSDSFTELLGIITIAFKYNQLAFVQFRISFQTRINFISIRFTNCMEFEKKLFMEDFLVIRQYLWMEIFEYGGHI